MSTFKLSYSPFITKEAAVQFLRHALIIKRTPACGEVHVLSIQLLIKNHILHAAVSLCYSNTHTHKSHTHTTPKHAVWTTSLLYFTYTLCSSSISISFWHPVAGYATFSYSAQRTARTERYTQHKFAKDVV